MSLTTTTGLIIKEQKVGEADRLVTVLTKDLGLIRAFAPGAQKYKSQNVSSTTLLAYSELTIYQSRDTYKINSAKSIEIFFDLRNDIVSLSLAYYFCELLLNLAPIFESAEDYLTLTLNCLHLLCKKTRSHSFIKSVFEMKIASFSGYTPDLSRCAKCNTQTLDEVGFDVVNGVVFCKECKTNQHYSIPNSVFTALQYIILADNKKAFSFKINEQSEEILSNISEKFILAQTEKNYKTLDFYKQMRI